MEFFGGLSPRRFPVVRVHARTKRDQNCWRLVSVHGVCTRFEQPGSAAAQRPATCWRDPLADILLLGNGQQGHAWEGEDVDGANPQARQARLQRRRQAGGGARVILLFPRPAHAPAPSWWRRVLSWLRYGTSAVAATQGSPRRPPCQAA